MDFMEVLRGPSNKFDASMAIGPKEHKALRDAIVYLFDRKNSHNEPKPVEHDGPLLTVPSQESMDSEPKKRGRKPKE